jgi:hypothetical protein
MAGDNVNVNFNTIGSLPPLPVSFNQLGSNGCFAKIEHGSLPPQRMAKIRPRCWSLPSQSAVAAVGDATAKWRFVRTAVIPLMKMLRPARMAAMRKLHCSIDL